MRNTCRATGREIRNPKAEIRKVRNPKAEEGRLRTACAIESTDAIRISAFGLGSDFGFRPSDLVAQTSRDNLSRRRSVGRWLRTRVRRAYLVRQIRIKPVRPNKAFGIHAAIHGSTLPPAPKAKLSCSRTK